MLNLNFQNGQAPALNARNMNAIVESINALGYAVGGPNVASTVSAMTDTSKVYVYTGSETGYTAGNWYYYNGSAWVSGGVYQATAVETDTTLTMPGEPADAKATGDAVTDLKSALETLDEFVNGEYSYNYTPGKALTANSASHSIIDDPDSCVSDMIPLTWTWDADTYCRFWYTDSPTDTKSYFVFFYDSNGGYLGYRGKDSGSLARSVKGYNNAAFVQFSYKKGFRGKITDALTTIVDTYWIATDTLITPGLADEVDKKAGIPVLPQDTSFIHISENMVNPNDVSNGYINQTNGVFTANAGHRATDWIPVDEGQSYGITNSSNGSFEMRYAWYNDSKTFISGGIETLANLNYVITAPAEAKWLRFSGTSGNYPFYCSKSLTKPTYEQYGNAYLLPEYAPDEDLNAVAVNVPENIYAFIGIELNIYFENIVEDWEKYKWAVTCSKGKVMERGFSITPVAGDAGSYPMTIRFYIDDNNYRDIETTLVVSPVNAGAGLTKSIIILGDSTTYNGIAVTKLHDNFADDVMEISTLGTMGTAPNNHEGRSGWTLNYYFTKASITYPAGDPRGTIYNPFYNPSTQTFDASYYFANSGIAKPDWFIINMGINDVFGYKNDGTLDNAIELVIGYVDAMIESIKLASPQTKIGICCTIPPNHSQDAFGKAYGCSQTRDRCKRNNCLLVNRLIDEYDGRTGEGVYLIPIHTNLDTVYNMGLETLPVNARNTENTYQSPIGNGGVHPVESGYWQIADVYTAFLKGNAT